MELLHSLIASETIGQALITENYFPDAKDAQKLVTILGLPHFHHHEKHSVTKTASAISLSKQGLPASASFLLNHPLRRGSSLSFHTLHSFLSSIDDESNVSGTRLVDLLEGSTHLSQATSGKVSRRSSLFPLRENFADLSGVQHQVATQIES